MSEITVPTSDLEATGGEWSFPEGWFTGTLEGPPEGTERIRGVPWDESESRLNMQFGDNEPMGEEDSPGAAKLFFDATIGAGGFNFHSINEAPEQTQKALLGSRKKLTQLAHAWGFTQEDGNGRLTFDIDSFIEYVSAGEFDGQKVSFETYQTTNKTTKKTRTWVRQFITAS